MLLANKCIQNIRSRVHTAMQLRRCDYDYGLSLEHPQSNTITVRFKTTVGSHADIAVIELRNAPVVIVREAALQFQRDFIPSNFCVMYEYH